MFGFRVPGSGFREKDRKEKRIAEHKGRYGFLVKYFPGRYPLRASEIIEEVWLYFLCIPGFLILRTCGVVNRTWFETLTPDP